MKIYYYVFFNVASSKPLQNKTKIARQYSGQTKDWRVWFNTVLSREFISKSNHYDYI